MFRVITFVGREDFIISIRRFRSLDYSRLMDLPPENSIFQYIELNKLGSDAEDEGNNASSIKDVSWSADGHHSQKGKSTVITDDTFRAIVCSR